MEASSFQQIVGCNYAAAEMNWRNNSAASMCPSRNTISLVFLVRKCAFRISDAQTMSCSYQQEG